MNVKLTVFIRRTDERAATLNAVISVLDSIIIMYTKALQVCMLLKMCAIFLLNFTFLFWLNMLVLVQLYKSTSSILLT